MIRRLVLAVAGVIGVAALHGRAPEHPRCRRDQPPGCDRGGSERSHQHRPHAVADQAGQERRGIRRCGQRLSQPLRTGRSAAADHRQRPDDRHRGPVRRHPSTDPQPCTGRARPRRIGGVARCARHHRTKAHRHWRRRARVDLRAKLPHHLPRRLRGRAVGQHPPRLSRGGTINNLHPAHPHRDRSGVRRNRPDRHRAATRLRTVAVLDRSARRASRRSSLSSCCSTCRSGW